MGEARRRKELGLPPKNNWAEVLSEKEQDEEQKDRAWMLEYNVPNRQAMADGMKRPIIIVADTRI